MEDPTSFDLNQAIRGWRDDLRRSPHLRQEDLLELESHVMDSMAAFRAKGLADDEAFVLATRRLGAPSGLAPEFAKINRTEVWLNRLLWMLIGVQVWGVLSGVARTVSNAVFLGGLWGLGASGDTLHAGFDWSRAVIPVALVTLAYLAVLAGTLAGCWRIVRRKESEAGVLLAWAMRRPVVLAVAATFALLLLPGLGLLESWLFAYNSPAASVGAVAAYQAVSGSLLQLAQTVGFVVLTVALLRRRFASAVPNPAQNR